MRRNPILETNIAKRQTLIDDMQTMLEKVEKEDRDLVDAERQILDETRTKITELNGVIEPLEQYEQLRAAHIEGAAKLTGGEDKAPGEPTPLAGAKTREHKYQTRGDFVVDYLRASGMDGVRDDDARQRVEASRGMPFQAIVRQQTTSDLAGLLPEPIIGEVLSDLDGERPTIASVGARPMAASDIPGKKFTRPFLATHTEAGVQATEGSQLATRELKVEEVTFDKATIGGWLPITRQSIDWTSPSAWNMLLTDLQDAYSVASEAFAAGELVAGVTQSVSLSKDDIGGWVKALYEAAVKAATADGTKTATSKRLPNTIWTSVDMWGSLGAILTEAKIQATNKPGNSSLKLFQGDILDVPRVVMPSAPAGTFIVGNSSRFEVYEARVGLLSAVTPSTAGIDVSHVGYVAAGFMDPSAFVKVTANP